MRKARRRMLASFPYLLALTASTVLGSCCVICVPIPHPGQEPMGVPQGVGVTLSR